ncbi:hypothetical protein SAMN06264364_14018 [Quadrisphaera granulorum]|uniref:Uncharacterized protein n=1 Tax=Quadrisphaera granulorum TaxID=317664 RepID=A0A315ZR91_9ACTN|nr:hypothetical protein [Quadrisphaera granulorum]PWJ47204.1 hypothetical protein BXY45_14018 [Quadrisphaera granulorum]SZE98890.1 hypothetical protein SAMN06264364_14018 [Quadrisphaera granulorum]
MIALNRAARVVLLLAVLWSGGSFAAALNWHRNWQIFAQGASATGPVAVNAQERWQHWIDMTLLGVVVAVVALIVALWPLVLAASAHAVRDAEGRGGHAGFGGGSEEGRQSTEPRDVA